MLNYHGLRAVFLCAITLCLSACGGGGSTSEVVSTPAQFVEMLWNPGPIYRASTPQDGDKYGICDVSQLVDMSESGNVGNPISNVLEKCTDGTLETPNWHSPSFYHNTAGWDAAHFQQSPGWNVEVLSGGSGAQMTLRITDDAQANGADCVLREVSVSYVDPNRNLAQWPGWSNPITVPNTVFKSEYDIEKFSSITGSFSAKLDSISTTSGCAAYPTNLIDNDVAIQYFDAAGNILRTDVLGVAIYDQGDSHISNSDLFYSNGCIQSSPICQAIVDGHQIGIPSLTSEWQYYSIEYKQLFARYFPAPPASSASSKWILFEAYSSNRDGSSIFEITDMDLKGVPL